MDFKTLLRPITLTNAGLVLFVLPYLKLFPVPEWYNFIPVSLIVAGTGWWLMAQLRQ